MASFDYASVIIALIVFVLITKYKVDPIKIIIGAGILGLVIF